MTPISAPSIVPVSSPPLTASAGPSNTQAANSKDGPLATTPVANNETSALTWLMTWLGEQNVAAEGTELPLEEAPAATAGPAKIGWLNLLPTLPPVEPNVIEAAPVPAPDAGTAPAPSAETALSIGGLQGNVEVREESADPSSGAVDEPEPVAPVAQVSVAPAAVFPGMPGVRPDQTSAEASPSQGESIAAPLGTPAPKQGKELSTQEHTPARSQIPVQPASVPVDKGEVIWSAKFTVAVEESAAAVPRATVSENRSELEAEPRTAPGPGPVVARIQTNLVTERELIGLPPQLAEAAEVEPPADPVELKRPKLSLLRERQPEGYSDESKHESASAGGGHAEANLMGSGTRISGFSGEFSSKLGEPGRIHEAAQTERAALEPAAPLKPAQVATLQVDVPTQVDGVEVTPMRLVVSQRGEQVNVRLRSFDGASSPLEDSRMQPLLHSLAEKGFVSEWKSGSRLGESVPLTVERTPERQMVMAESSGSQNDMQSFQKDHERQQQNQERQQQQQAVFLRKQLRGIQAEEFTLPALAEANRSTLQQGVPR